jgi:hypothetical protein
VEQTLLICLNVSLRTQISQPGSGVPHSEIGSTVGRGGTWVMQ